MSKCYHFKLIKSSDENNLFDKIVDATYIIHLENNGRYENIMNQIKCFNICNKIYILFNKGFKNCKKSKHIVSSVEDLTDSYIQIFKHAESFKYNNILVLEDDFMFSPNIKKHISNIQHFFDIHNGENFVYSLGSVPFIMIPYMKNHYRVYSAGTHAIIYTKSSRIQLLNEQNRIVDIDIYKNLNLTTYTYYKPLCYQLFPITENSNNWGKEKLIYHFGAKMMFKLFSYFEMDKKVEPGYSRFYMFSKAIYFIIIFLCAYIAYFVFHKKNNIRYSI